MEILTMTIAALIINVCADELKIENCEEKVNACVDAKVWEFREKLYEVDDEMMQILLNECVEEMRV